MSNNKYYQKNKEILLCNMKKYYEKNKKKLLEYGKNHYKNNKKNYKIYYQKLEVKMRLKEHRKKPLIKEYHKIYNKKYSQKNRDIIQIKQIEYRRKNNARRNAILRYRLKNELNYRLKNELRSRIWNVLKNNKKCKKTMELIGCSFEYFTNYIECQFDDEMSWYNWGMKGWHLDHILPCASFDLAKEEEQLKCFNYSNIQPLWGKINMSKGSKI